MSTFTVNKNIEQPAHNSFVDTWDTPLNADLALIDTCLGASVSLNAAGLSGNQTLTTAQYQPLTIFVTGAPSGTITYVVPTGVGGQWIFVNNTSGGQTVGIKSNAGGATITVAATQNTIVSCDGSSSGMRIAVNVPPAAGGSATQVQFNSGGTLAGSASLTWNGTTLAASGLNIAGNNVLGLNSGSTLTLNGNTATIPNDLTIGASNLLLLKSSTTQVAIGTATPTAGSILTVAGNIKITTGGLIFSDGTQITTAGGLSPQGASGSVQFNNSGSFGGDSAHFTYNNGTHTLSVDNLVLATALPVAQGGTGVTTSTGTTNVVLSASPTLTGNPIAPTQAALTNNTRIATTAYADNNLIQIATVSTTTTSALTGTYATSTGAIPTTANGTPISALSTTFTPKSASSILEFDLLVKGTPNSAGDTWILALFNNTTLIDMVGFNSAGAGGLIATIALRTWLASPGTSAITLNVRIGANGGSGWILNQTNTGGGGVQQSGMISWITIKEILPHP